MKLQKSEIWAVGITAALFLLLLGFQYGARRAPAEITVTELGAPAPTEMAEKPEPTADASAPININTADEAALRTLQGVGEVLAQRIVDYRTEHGPFQSVDELTNVKGIGSGILEANRARLTVGEETP